MLFNSLSFLIFFPVVALLYFVLPYKVRNLWLLIASYFFYANANIIFCFIMLAVTVLSYFAGILINYYKNKFEEHNATYFAELYEEHIAKMGGGRSSVIHSLIFFFKHLPSNSQYKAKLVTIISVILVALSLIFFKYTYFLIDSLNGILSIVNISISYPTFSIILPLGISFYTLQVIAYLIDTYRGTSPYEKNFIDYALFVSFFPKLIAGPIERASAFIPQLKEKHIFNYEAMKNGLLLMIYGYFLKMVIADRAAILVNNIFTNYEAYHGLEIAVAVIFFAVQLYADFAGYSWIAMGAAEVMGFKLILNFNHPFFATSVGDYWRRWHRSFSLWLRDYIYFTLGGSRCSKLKKYRNLYATFFVSGMWHGVGYQFLIWGLMHATCLVCADIAKPYVNKINAFFKVDVTKFGYRFMQIFITFLLVSFTRLFYRADDVETAITMTKYMFEWNPWIFFDGSLFNMGLDAKDFIVLIVSLMVLWGVSFCQERFKIREKLAEQFLPFRWACYITFIMIILIFGVYGEGFDAAKFIYMQF